MKGSKNIVMKKFHGVFSASLFFFALILAAYSIILHQLTIGIAYLIAIPIGFLGVAGTFCTKCPCAPKNCSHVILGYLTVLFPKREAGNYKTKVYVYTGLILAVLVGFPQYWLVGNIELFIVFWTLTVLAGLEIAFYVCKNCGNRYCAMCKNKKSINHEIKN